MHVLGRAEEVDGPAASPAGRLGVYRAPDGSDGAAVGVDLDRPHVGAVVGKRGSGKSHTLGVLGEELVRTPGTVPVVLDPMGGLAGLADAADGEAVGDGEAADDRGDDAGAAPIDPGATDAAATATDAARPTLLRDPTVRADAIPPSAWPSLLGVDAADAIGSLLWRAAERAATLAGMREYVADADASRSARRGARNHLDLAASWGVFDPCGIDPRDLLDGGAVLDLSGLAPAPTNAVARAVARGLYEACLRADPATLPALPWLLVDEAHVLFEGVAAPALERVLTRGRAPGVSLVVATQRPAALPTVALSQADLLVAHRLTAEADVGALAAATPTFLRGSLRERLPSERGCAVVVDDATASVHGVRVRDRRTPHGGASPRAREVARAPDRATGGGDARTEMPE